MSTATTKRKGVRLARDSDRSLNVVPRHIRFNQALADAVKSAAALRGDTVEQYLHDTLCEVLNRPDLKDKSPGALLRNAG